MLNSIKREIPLEELSTIIPSLLSGRYKGQNGKIGIIGGSFEYTGAPYYGAAAVLRGGGDLAHIFCTSKAATPIKSYSPEVIVHPYLLSEAELNRAATNAEIENCVKSITKWYDAVNGVVIGSGLGRDNAVAECIEDLYMNMKELVTVCDGDFFWFLSDKNKESLAEKIRKRSKVTILTPNKVEFKRMWGLLKGDEKQVSDELRKSEIEKIMKVKESVIEISIENPIVKDQVEIANKLNNVNILEKGEVDVVTNGKQAYIVKESGCYKRCGGQGDVLAGLSGLYGYWDYLHKKEKQIDVKSEKFDLLGGCMLASYVTRYAAARAFEKFKYGTTTPSILEEVHVAINRVQEKGMVYKSKL